MAIIRQNKKTSNLLIFAAIAAAAIAGYFMLTANSTPAKKDSTGSTPAGGNTTPGGGNTNPGGGTTIEPAVCDASASQFPLVIGSGYSGRPNNTCEQVYVKNVQTVLNKFLTRDGKVFLAIDGKFGQNTANVVMQYYGGLPQVSKSLYDSMMNYFK